jgi:mono/diheme cytochrome c family protein
VIDIRPQIVDRAMGCNPGSGLQNMNRIVSVSAFLALLASLTIMQRAAAQTAPAADQNRATLTTYCVTCHNARLKTGGIAFDNLDLAAAPDDAQIWEKAPRKLRGHLMPPPGAPQPPQKDIDSFVAFMENTLDTHAKGPKAGHVPRHPDLLKR